MAKHVGQFPLVGTLGNVNFYEHETAGNIARMKPGPSREKVKHDKSFERTRKYNTEFGRASKYGALIRQAMHAIKLNCKNGTMASNLVQRITDIMKMDGSSAEGKRDIRKDTITALRHFELDEKQISRQYFEMPVVTHTRKGCLDVSACVSLNKVPEGAAGWRIVSVAAGIDFRKKESKSDVQYGEIYHLQRGRFEVAFTHSYTDKLPLFHGMSIEFYSYNAVIDEYRLIKGKHIHCGFFRCVQG